MRWLLLKDLQILRRSKLLVSLLIIYPIAIATLMGFALSSGPDKPRVAFLNQVPANRETIQLGDQKLNIRAYTGELLKAIETVPVSSRAEALEKVRSGAVLAAMIIPSDFTQKLSTGGFSRASVEVVYNGDALKQSFVTSTITSKLAAANAALSGEVNRLATRLHRRAAQRRRAEPLRRALPDPRPEAVPRAGSTRRWPTTRRRRTSDGSARSRTSPTSRSPTRTARPTCSTPSRSRSTSSRPC